MKKILIIGATSAIAHACARRWATQCARAGAAARAGIGAGAGARFALIARDATKLQQNADDLSVLGAASVYTRVLDLNHFDQHAAALDECITALDGVDIALIAHGTLPDQTLCQQHADETLKALSTNGLGVISLATLLANHMEAGRHGTLAVISSVAGDRGRASNYVYGAAKSAVTAFCEGLRGRLFRAGVHVLTIKPGFVDTPMTRDLALPPLLVASPERVAAEITRAIERKTDVLYTPGFWALIMFVIRALPSFVFKRLKL